ncbi:iron ABC transporter permease [Sesbania bispinosa]|nr:iron ABC transporter permease [Sesbania bispinosa]
MASTSQTSSPFHSGGGRLFSRMHNLKHSYLLLSLFQLFHQSGVPYLGSPDLIFSFYKFILNSTFNEGDGEQSSNEVERLKSRLQSELFKVKYQTSVLRITVHVRSFQLRGSSY